MQLNSPCFLFLIFLTSCFCLDISVSQVTRPLVWSNNLFDLHILQVNHAGVIVCIDDFRCKLFEYSSTKAIKPQKTSSKIDILTNFQKLSGWEVKESFLFSTKTNKNENEFWRYLQSNIIPEFAYSPLNTNCFKFVEIVCSLINPIYKIEPNYPRSSQALDLDILVTDINNNMPELLSINLSEFDSSDSKFYLKSDANTGRVNVVFYISSDVKLKYLFSSLLAFVTHIDEERVVRHIRRTQSYFGETMFWDNFDYNLADISADEELMQKLDTNLDKIYSIFIDISDIMDLFTPTTQKRITPQTMGGNIMFTAISYAVWIEIQRDNLILFNILGKDLSVINIGDFHLTENNGCNIIEKLTIANYYLNDRLIMLFDNISWTALLINITITVVIALLYLNHSDFILLYFYALNWKFGLVYTIVCMCPGDLKRNSAKKQLFLLVLFLQIIITLILFIILFSIDTKTSNELIHASSVLKELNNIVNLCGRKGNWFLDLYLFPQTYLVSLVSHLHIFPRFL